MPYCQECGRYIGRYHILDYHDVKVSSILCSRCYDEIRRWEAEQRRIRGAEQRGRGGTPTRSRGSRDTTTDFLEDVDRRIGRILGFPSKKRRR